MKNKTQYKVSAYPLTAVFSRVKDKTGDVVHTLIVNANTPSQALHKINRNKYQHAFKADLILKTA